jgi:hypothetical protein
MLTNIQKNQLLALGIEEIQIENQIKNFKQGFSNVRLLKPAIVNDGILKPSEDDLTRWIEQYNNFSKTANIIKFVPASGAASRMFKSLFEFLNNPVDSPEVSLLIQNIEKYAFFDDLDKVFKKKNKELHNQIKEIKPEDIIRAILYDEGLNYGNLPKGLLKFHKYPEGSRTSVEEHVVEGLKYAIGKETLNLHFTISPEHEKFFKDEFARILTRYADYKISISYSFQKKSTDTIAVDMNNEPLLDNDGKFIFRPGGHGALLDNLNDLNADLIFIKNIDNVVPDNLKLPTIRYKKALAGIVVELKQQIRDIINYLESNSKYSAQRKQEISQFVEKNIGLKVPDGIDDAEYTVYIRSILDKPIRVCGMVKNIGEPGGGPFWTLNRKNEPSLQIIESSQVNMNDVQQKSIFNGASHFNPVDLVCSTKDYAGNKFNLFKYRDPDTGFISEKSTAGKKLKALELPGLWNGSMAHWITVFVEVPLETFNPVKTFTDWLRKEHQPE